MKNIRQILRLAAFSSMVIWMTGCCGLSAKREGIAFIRNQPVDKQAKPGERVEFRADVTGGELAYQWYFENEKGSFPLADGNTDRYVIPAAKPSQTGFYWCLIDSSSRITGTKQTRTRSASLIVAATITTAVPEPSILRSSAAKSNLCAATICGYLNFNNLGAGYKSPDNVKVKCVAKLTTTAGAVVNTSDYELLWRSSASDFNCCTNLSTTQKSVVVSSSKTYAFTAYLKSGCVLGSTCYLTVEFVAP